MINENSFVICAQSLEGPIHLPPSRERNSSGIAHLERDELHRTNGMGALSDSQKVEQPLCRPSPCPARHLCAATFYDIYYHGTRPPTSRPFLHHWVCINTSLFILSILPFILDGHGITFGSSTAEDRVPRTHPDAPGQTALDCPRLTRILYGESIRIFESRFVPSSNSRGLGTSLAEWEALDPHHYSRRLRNVFTFGTSRLWSIDTSFSLVQFSPRAHRGRGRRGREFRHPTHDFALLSRARLDHYLSRRSRSPSTSSSRDILQPHCTKLSRGCDVVVRLALLLTALALAEPRTRLSIEHHRLVYRRHHVGTSQCRQDP